MDLRFNIHHLREAAIITHFSNSNNFCFISLNKSGNAVIWGKIINGKSHILESKFFPLSFKTNACRLKIQSDRLQFFLEGEKIFDIPNTHEASRFGFLSEIADTPPTLFSKIALTGILQNGITVSVQDPHKSGFKTEPLFFGLSFLLLCLAALFLLGATYFFKTWGLLEPVDPKNLSPPQQVGWKTAIALHLAIIW